MLIETLTSNFARGLAGPSWTDPAALFPTPGALAEAAGFPLDPWQYAAVNSDAPEQLWLCGRQVGKSLAAAVRAVWTAVAESGSLTLVAAPAMRQAGEAFLKVKALLNALGPRAPAIRRESTLALTTATGSRIVVIPGDERTVRGYSSVRLLVLDEAARIPDPVYQALRPMLAVSQGTVLALTTAAGARGWFHQEWTQGGPGWRRVIIPARDCPRLSPAWLAAERKRIGDWWFSQEYDCVFVDSASQVFASEDIQAAFDEAIPPLFPGRQVA